MSGLDLFPDELRGSVPPLRSQEGADDPIIVARFLTRDANWVEDLQMETTSSFSDS